MKIRSGFVSNSSSSSFIVAFPKKPTDKNELSEMMFPKDLYGSIGNPWPGLNAYDGGLEHTRIVEQVFSDIQEQKKKFSTKETVDELSGRYFVMDGKLYYEGAPYYALDSDLAKQIMELHNEHEKQEKEFDKQTEALLEKHLGPAVPYASSTGTNWKTRKPYTPEEIADYMRYCKKRKKFSETNEEFLLMQQAQTKARNKYYEETRKISDKMAKFDWKSFSEDNTGAFFSRFTYSDNDGEFFSMMEHGGIFGNLHHIRISHH